MTFVHLFEFVEIFPPFLLPAAGHVLIWWPRLPARGCRSELSPAGLPPSVPDFAIPGGLISARKEAGESQTPGFEA